MAGSVRIAPCFDGIIYLVFQKGDNKSRDRSVTFDEFVEYYNNVSCSCPNDEYFQLMMVNAWQLDGHTNF